MVNELVSLQLMLPTHESSAPIYSFGFHPQISSTVADIPFSEQEDEEDIDKASADRSPGRLSAPQRSPRASHRSAGSPRTRPVPTR